MKQKITAGILLGLISFYCSVSARAQTGKIAGVITDKKTGETLIGLSISVQGSQKGTVTDVNGKYVLSALAPGKYTINFSYVSYATKSISDVEVKSGAVTNLDVIMEPSASQVMKEVVIKASARQETSNALYAAQKNSASTSDGISADAIKKTPDRNTSDVLKRVSGATIQDNKYVVVRGLSDRYNTALLDNAALPSTEPNRKAFSFDIVPSNLVDKLVINKTATPDLPGDFTGGAVQIITRGIPEQNFTSFSVGTGYNSVATLNNFQSGPRNLSDFFGFDNGDRALSASMPSRAKLAAGLGPDQQLAAIKTLPQDWNIYNNSAMPALNFQVALGRVKEYEKNNRKLGMIASVTYRNSQTAQADMHRDYYEYAYTDNQYKFTTNLGALANFAYNYGNSKITLKNIYNRTFDDQYLYREGILSKTLDVRYYAFDQLQKTLLKSTLEGTHVIGKKNAKIVWSAAYSNVINDQPDQRKLGYRRDRTALPLPAFSANLTTGNKENARLYSDLNEDIYSGSADYSRGIKLFKTTSTLKAGLNSQYRNRDFTSRFITMSLDPTKYPDEYKSILERPIQKLFAKDLINRNVYNLTDLATLTDTYNGTSMVNAGYAMLDTRVTEKLRAVWGARVEAFSLDLKTADPKAVPINRDDVDVLPSVNLTYAITSKTNFRASYFRSLARPEFRELAPAQYYDYEFSSSYEGNASLKSSTIDNFDIRYEIYPKGSQVISISGFYKNFTNAIEAVLDDANSLPNTSYFNSKKATVYGLELEFRKSLEFISKTPFLSRTQFYSNVSVVRSEVTNPDNRPYLEKKRQMVGQAPYVINGGLQSTFMKERLGVNALYNRVGRRIYRAAGILFPSIWEAPRNVVDLQLSYKLIRSKAELKLNAGDIFNNSAVFYWDRDLNKKYAPSGTTDETISRYKPGSNYSLSFSYTF